PTEQTTGLACTGQARRAATRSYGKGEPPAQGTVGLACTRWARRAAARVYGKGETTLTTPPPPRDCPPATRRSARNPRPRRTGSRCDPCCRACGGCAPLSPTRAGAPPRGGAPRGRGAAPAASAPGPRERAAPAPPPSARSSPRG